MANQNVSEQRMTYKEAALLQGEIQSMARAAIVDVREREDGGDGYYLAVKRLRLDELGNVTYDPFFVFSPEDWAAWLSRRDARMPLELP